MKKQVLRIAFFMVLGTQVFAQATADKTTLRKKEFNLGSKQVAISGYDPVSYFSSSKPKIGKPEFEAVFQGVKYNFSSLENKEAFLKNPQKYEPQYGGWCAYAMGNDGSKVEIDPETYKILNGKLYLFYNKYFTNTLKLWNKDENNLFTKAESNWNKIYK